MLETECQGAVAIRRTVHTTRDSESVILAPALVDDCAYTYARPTGLAPAVAPGTV